MEDVRWRGPVAAGISWRETKPSELQQQKTTNNLALKMMKRSRVERAGAKKKIDGVR